MVVRPRAHLAAIPPCPHGSLSGEEAREILDFSASCNPLGAAPSVLAAIQTADPSRYPDDGVPRLRKALAEAQGVEPEWVAVGNGSVDLLWLLATAYLDPGDLVLVVGPTFGEFSRACRVADATVVGFDAVEEDGFQIDMEALGREIRRLRPRLAFMCNPNNPTGQLLVGRQDVSEAGDQRRGASGRFGALLDCCRETLLVVDEAYAGLCPSAPDLRPYLSSRKVLLLRSMTKDHGLAGIRLGYALAHPDITQALNWVRPPWNVNAAAEAAGLAALEAQDHLEETRRIIEEAKAYLIQGLEGLGLQVVPGEANFFLAKVGDGAGFRSSLLKQGVCVRDCASFGLPEYVRIGVRTMPDCRRLLEAAERAVKS